MQMTDRQARLRKLSLRVLAITLSALLIAVNLKSFVQAGDLFPGGFTGLARLIQRAAAVYLHVDLPFAPVNLALNAVPAVISFKLVGKRFTLYSCLSILMVSLFTDMVPSLSITEDILLISIFGGMLNGVAIAMCLWVRVTTGGTDFVAIALSERKNVDAWNYILMGNVVMLAVAGALFGWDKALYSIIFQFVTTQVLKVLDPDARRATLLIVTGRDSLEPIRTLIHETHHTGTVMEGAGMYDGEEKVMIYSVVEDSLVRSLTSQVRQIDPRAFVNVLRTEKVVGKFYRRPRD